jgi:hypothetical protein
MLKAILIALGVVAIIAALLLGCVLISRALLRDALGVDVEDE